MTTTLLKLTVAAAAVVCAVGAGVWGFSPVPAPTAAPVQAPTATTVPAAPAAPAAAPVTPEAAKPVARMASALQRVKSTNNLKQIMIAIHSYHDANNAMPTNVIDKDGKPLLSWRVQILPYIDEEQLYKKFQLDEPWDSENNKKLLAMMPNMFKTGIEPKGPVKTYYRAFAGPRTAFDPGKKVSLANFTDGLSNTIGVIEAGPAVEWTKPEDIAYDPKKAFPKLDGPFSNVVMAGMMDGSVFPCKPDLKDAEFHKFVDGADGNIVDHDKAKADLKAITKEDRELAVKMLKENIELAKQVSELMVERNKLVVELVKKPQAGGPDLEKLTAAHKGLSLEIAELKQQIEELKKELDKK